MSFVFVAAFQHFIALESDAVLTNNSRHHTENWKMKAIQTDNLKTP
jgi:hypothetical protein